MTGYATPSWLVTLVSLLPVVKKGVRGEVVGMRAYTGLYGSVRCSGHSKSPE